MISRRWIGGLSAATLMISTLGVNSARSQTIDLSGQAMAGALDGTGGLTGSTAGEVRYDGGLSSFGPSGLDVAEQNEPGSVASAHAMIDQPAAEMAELYANSVGQGLQPAGATAPGGVQPPPTGASPWATPPR